MHWEAFGYVVVGLGTLALLIAYCQQRNVKMDGPTCLKLLAMALVWPVSWIVLILTAI